MSDLIDRQKAIDTARDWYEGLICGSFKGLEKRLRALPSAQPDVLACGSGELVQETDSLVKDCISRQAVIDAIAYANFNFTISGKRGFQNYKEEFEKASFAIRDKYIEALKALPSAEPRWIPVDERLPEVGESVLVTFSLIEKYSWVKIARYGTPIHDEHNVCFYESDSEWGDCEISGVTAWMPLPEPYQEVSR